MAQSDAMDQAKEFLRQVIKYRFWISISVAALFAVIAYFVGSGPIKARTTKEESTITTAEKGVKAYASGGYTDQYKPIVEEKTAVLETDVNAAWKSLYDRQAPLLTWPEAVQERFRKWGRKWPEEEDKGRVLYAIIDYMEAYPAYVTMVYKTFKPFDYETGEGIVVAAPEQALLRPAVFQTEKPPDLGKVWAAQERLWIQRTLLEVVAQVNKNAKNWDTAIIRQIDALEVGNSMAQDQRSIAKSDELAEAEKIFAPGEEVTEESGGGGGAGGAAGAMANMMGGKRGEMMGGRLGGAAAQDGAAVFYLKPADDKGQYKMLPILMTVLIDQDHIQDLLVEMENSPMSIQVMDFELARPISRVVKPEKGTAFAGNMGGGMMGGMMNSMMRQAGMGRMSGYGGLASSMQNQMQGQMMSQMAGMMGARGGMMAGMPGMGAVGAPAQKKGIDKRNVDAKKVREQKEKAVTESQGVTLFDPYFDIVQVTVYGRARFYNPPPAGPAPEPSSGDAAATAKAEPAKADDAPKETAAAKVEPADAAKPADTPVEKAAAGPESKTSAAPAAAPAEAGASKSAPAEPAKDGATTEPNKPAAATGPADKAAPVPPTNTARPKNAGGSDAPK
jgi:hypothetical protein